MLAPLRLAGGAAGIHEEQRVLGRQLDRIDTFSDIVLEHVVDNVIAALDRL